MTDEVTTDTAPAQSADTAPEGSTETTTTTQPETQTTTTDTTQGDDASTKTGDRSQLTDEGDKTQENGDTEFKLPDEYKDKPWAEKIKSQEDAYKQIENLTALVGKKTIQPIDYENATPEEIEAHHKTLAPEDVKSYQFSEESIPEITGPMGELFQKAGLHPHQAKTITDGFDEVIAQVAGDKMKADTSEEGYFKIMEESFGEKHKEVAGFVETNLNQYATAEDKALFNEVDNVTRTAIDRTVFNILKAHGVTESAAQVEGSSGSPNVTDVEGQRKDLRQKIRDLDSKPHTAEEKAALTEKLANTYK